MSIRTLIGRTSTCRSVHVRDSNNLIFLGLENFFNISLVHDCANFRLDLVHLGTIGLKTTVKGMNGYRKRLRA